MSTKLKYQFLKELDPESTSSVFLIQDLSNFNSSSLPKFYACKTEKASVESSKLKHEHKVLLEVAGKGVPTVQWAGTSDGK